MLTFADTAWHVFANMFVFLIGFSIAIGQKRMFGISHKLAIALYFWHTFFCLFYFWYSLNNTADSTSYYLRSLDYDSGFKFGTVGLHFLVSFFSQVFSLSYGGVFLIFNIIGYIGMLAFGSALQHVTLNSSRFVRRLSIIVLFLPGLSFWSSAIGKDASTFAAAGLATWSALNISRRAPVMAIAILLFLLPRPHMAGILLLAIALAMFFSSGIGIFKKVFLLILVVPLSVLSVQFGLEYAGVGDAADLNDIGDYFEERQGHNMAGGGSVDISGMSVPLRLFTYLFRPLLFDASGLMGLIISFENIFLLLILLASMISLLLKKSSLGRFEMMFFVVFSFISWFVLANTTANLGISIRQKWMFLPMLLVLAFSYLSGPPKRRPPRGSRR